MLDECGYDGPLTIEREISGDKQKQDILDTVEFLRELMK
jgi:sugar phosphate isomerase/epimerase